MKNLLLGIIAINLTAAIGSARDNALATVARILVMTPKKYAGKDLKITCKEIE